MIEKCYKELEKKQNLRENLSRLKSEIKNPAEKQKLSELSSNGELLFGFLKEEEPKVRKNAALLIGDLGLDNAVEPLWEAYHNETTLFVKSSYLAALGKLEVSDYLEDFKALLLELTGVEPDVNERKHINQEIRELEKIIMEIEGIRRHTWTDFAGEHEFLLATNREQRNVTLREISEMSETIRRKTKLHPLGVLVTAREAAPFTRLRTYRELLFPLHMASKTENSPEKAAEAVWSSDLMPLLKECHKQAPPFYFRLELKGRMNLEQKSSFAKKFAVELERLSERQLVNSTRDYEIEIRLLETKDGSVAAFAKFFTIPMKRFAYRKHAIATSIHPATAAMLVELAKPYLKENAQILDPFCGVGTMLIERDIKVPAREKYGIDIFGEAVRLARENTAAAGQMIHYINRNYFDFKHTYRFDEIITNMPMRGKKTKEEMDKFYSEFFAKSKSILCDGGIMILYTNEEGFVKKQLRLNAEYRLVQEHCVREREQFYLYIIAYKIR